MPTYTGTFKNEQTGETVSRTVEAEDADKARALLAQWSHDKLGPVAEDPNNPPHNPWGWAGFAADE